MCFPSCYTAPVPRVFRSALPSHMIFYLNAALRPAGRGAGPIHTYIHTPAPTVGSASLWTRLWTGLGTGLCATVDWLATLSDRFLPPQARDQIVRASQGFLV